MLPVSLGCTLSLFLVYAIRRWTNQVYPAKSSITHTDSSPFPKTFQLSNKPWTLIQMYALQNKRNKLEEGHQDLSQRPQQITQALNQKVDQSCISSRMSHTGSPPAIYIYMADHNKPDLSAGLALAKPWEIIQMKITKTKHQALVVNHCFQKLKLIVWPNNMSSIQQANNLC